MRPLSDAEFAEVRAYLVAEAGLVFDESRRAGLSATLADRVATVGADDIAGYLTVLRSKDGASERQRLLDSVTVQETHFFRNPPQMEALRRQVLPDLLRLAGGRERPLTIWSAGCSTGEEPYTLAMLLLELSPMLGTQTQARILGTDVSSQALRAAGRATYTGRSLDATPPMVRDRWLEPEPGGSYRVKDQARRLVELRLHNLVTEPAPFGPGEVDLIVCRNVTIYFDRETTAAIIASFAGLLAEGGYLVLGHSETLWQMTDAFTVVPVGDAFVYRRSVDELVTTAAAGRPAVAAGAVPSHGGSGAHGAPGGTGGSGVVGKRVAVGVGASAAAASRTAPAPPDVTRRAATRGADSRRDADLLLADARTRLASGDYAAAAMSAAQAVASDPLRPPAYVVLGQARLTLGQDAVAVETLRKAVYLDPAGGHAHFLLAGALSRTGQHAAAAVSYRAAARAVAGMTPAERGELMDGRDGGELAALCERLADEALASAAAADEVASTPGGRL
jgi:chemotaxis protein methyltransferase CheR